MSSSPGLLETRTPALEARGLAKRFGARHAVVDVSFAVRRGEVFGFLGPNGAGKTTTIRMLVGLVRPTLGQVTVGGWDLATERERALGRLGCIVESPDFYPYLSARENLAILARMARMARPGPPSDDPERGAAPADAAARVDDPLDRIDEVADWVRIRERLEDRVSTYSLGMRQRLGIAQALLGAPDVMVLDEPANGLDPAGIVELRRLLRRLADERGLAVFVSSHLLGEIEKVCDRIAIVHRGRALTEGTVEELTRGGRRTLESVFLDVTAGQTVGD
jgi:ABC-2 type transport system ATP-binding protein